MKGSVVGGSEAAPGGGSRPAWRGGPQPAPGGPAVSVVLPVRDGERTLGAALESLRAQTFAHFEVLVVDDGSRDGSGGIARAWERRDGRFRVVRVGGAGGVGGSDGSGGVGDSGG